ncbi:MAG: S8 family peptidase [Candidatus Zixiibacteriota bacterium]
MKKAILLLSIICIAFGDYIPGRMIIHIDPEYETKLRTDNKFTCGIEDVDNLFEYYGSQSGKYLIPVRKMNEHYASKVFDMRNLLVVSFIDKDMDLEAASDDFRNLDCVIDASPDYLEHEHITTPSDAQYPDQWHLRQIRANYAWDFNTGDSTIIAAHFEAVDWQHPDIAPLLWQNLGEDADGDGRTIERRHNWSYYGNYEYYYDPDDLNGIDDDGNGYIDDLIGWDFIDFTDDPLDEVYQHDMEDYYEEDNDPYDDVGAVGHGTHVAGTMLGAANNDSIGTVGVAWAGKLMALKAGYYYMRGGTHLTGTHPHSFSIAAYTYARLNGARVWNMSYGGNNYNGMVSAVLQRAQDSSKVFMVAASGNEGDSESHYPSNYTGVMAVAATDEDDMPADFTTFGRRIAICAPGVDIFAPIPLHSEGSTVAFPFEGKDGTSMASPIVAGAGILMLAEHPEYNWVDVYSRLQEYAVPIDHPLFEADSLGDGRLNLYTALYQEVYPHFYLDSIAVLPAEDDEDGRIDVGETGYVYVYYHCDEEWQDPGEMTLYLSSEHDGIDVIETGISLPDIAPGDSIDNFGTPLTFTVNEALDEGDIVTFDIELQEESGYFRKDTANKLIGYPKLLIYDRDGGELVETYIFNDLRMGNVNYEHYDADLHGPIDSDFLNDNFDYVVFLNGRNDSIPITTEEIDAFSSFLDISGKCMYLSGQYLADDPIITDFLADYFKAEHIADELPSRFWGMSTLGVDGDTVGNGLDIDVTMGADAFGPQNSIGQCQAIEDGINVFYYNGHEDVFCATRYETPSNKTFFSEFSIAGVEGQNPGSEIRFHLLARVLQWFGQPFTAVQEGKPFSAIPDRLDIIAYPNPFNSAVSFKLGEFSGRNTKIEIYNTNGRLIDTIDAGSQRTIWRPDSYTPAGVYLYRAIANEKIRTGKILYIK